MTREIFLPGTLLFIAANEAFGEETGINCWDDEKHTDTGTFLENTFKLEQS